jgi:hypothetical protein
MTRRKHNKYTVGSKNCVIKLIDKKLDKKIKRKMNELKKESNEPEKITYIYASKIIAEGKK